jgi:hypothetical protein
MAAGGSGRSHRLTSAGLGREPVPLARPDETG